MAHEDLQQRIARLEATIADLQRVIAISGATVTIRAQGNLVLSGAGNVAITAGRSMEIKAMTSCTVTGAKDCSVAAGNSLQLKSDRELTIHAKNTSARSDDIFGLKIGDASLSMKKDGSVDIHGKDITLDGSGKVNVKASSDVVLKGSKILQN